ncbi:7-carboxy-7-deazaguanine synthase QueE [Ruegeria sp. A3M17]|uniref:7-carboxy-7-deazaguanine synthase QueE n=1 Tax=Ruegeria sp. A3M17 TaxID=2267229 RepID=UPI000DEA1FA0|nr:7-carboxy-7-deazaguanine synthase QueE [Ruegeria sp. A3M17]RBW62835.1 7-carboxy-7-deazaguanine synthase QueE [Ruegeria sp. A3M17]
MTLKISEIFGPTVQGEGALIGQPTVFVRSGGCDFRCSWCDSLHAVDSAYRHDWAAMETQAVWSEVQRLSGGRPLTVSLSGGNPAIQDFGPLIQQGKAEGYAFACETQGSIAKPWFADLAMLVLSPKPPSSGEDMDWTAFDACLNVRPAQTVLKIVIFDDTDFNWARSVADRHPDLPLYVQPGNPETDPASPVDLTNATSRMDWLIDKTLNAGWFAPRILPQLHVLIWGNKHGV